MSATLLSLDAEVVPRTLVFDPPLSDGELERLCQRNDVVRIERTSQGAIRVNPPTGLLTSDGNAEIIHQLRVRWETHRRGRVFDSNAGFFLADGSLLSPDAAYVLPEQLQGLTKADLARMPHLCPAFVVELLSPSDSLVETQKKMDCWIANGAQLAWLVDPYRQCVEVYQPGLASFSTSAPRLPGVGPVAGFELDLAKVWRCYEV
jgi:Uma2 family endonuclease